MIVSASAPLELPVPQAASIVEIARQALQEHACLAAGQTMVVAVSGGADSLCLLHVLWTLCPDLGIRLHVAHLDHGLRGESARADARFVAQTAAQLGLPVTVEARDVAAHQRLRRLTLEEAAREVRYAFLLEVAQRTGAVAVATGHTADDTVETMVLHWLRGAGLAGMRGIPAVRELRGFTYGSDDAVRATNAAPPEPPVVLLRPFLQVTRAQTEAYCHVQGLDFRVDETNLDLSIARNRIRRQLLPELESYNPGLHATLLRSARAAADDFDYISSQTLAAWPGVVAPSGGDEGLTLTRDAFRVLPAALQRGLLRRALEQVWGGWQDFGWVHLEALRSALIGGRVGTVVDLPHGLTLSVGYAQAHLAARAQVGAINGADPDLPLLQVEELPVAVPGNTALPGTRWRLEVEAVAPAPGGVGAQARGEGYVDAGAVGVSLVMRRPRAGDRFQPLGMAGTKKLHDLFVDEKVPRQLRGQLPVLAAGERIVWVGGRWLADWARLRPDSRQAWHLRFLQGV